MLVKIKTHTIHRSSHSREMQWQALQTHGSAGAEARRHGQAQRDEDAGHNEPGLTQGAAPSCRCGACRAGVPGSTASSLEAVGRR